MIPRLIELCGRHRLAVFGVVLALLGWSLWSIKRTPLDAVPDLSDPQVIVFTDWMGRSPNLVEDQITYPLVRVLQSTPNVRTVRGYSMFGMSFVYAIFDEDTDIYWARTRVLEQLGRVSAALPPGVAPTLGPDATGIGWVYQYVLEDTSGRLDLAQLRELQDFTIRPALQATPGVSEVASIGGFERQYQIAVDPNKLAGYGLSLSEITRAAGDANSETGARVIESAGREFVLRGRGYVKKLSDLEESAVTLGPGGTPIRLRDVANVRFGPEIRRGAADWDGKGEAAGGIVVMRIGSNALAVIDALKTRISELPLPDGVRLVPTYDRSGLIRASIGTLSRTLIEEAIIVSLVFLVFLFHVRSALVVVIMLPVAIALSFIPMHYLGMTSNIMSLGGIAIAIGAMTDAAIVLIENAHVRLADAPAGADRAKIVIDACKQLGAPIFFSLLLITVSFMPIFLLPGQSGRLFRPLAFTKTFAMFSAALLSVTLVPVLMVLLLRGRIRREDENPVSRVLVKLYEPVARVVVRARWAVAALALFALFGTVPIYLRVGSEFMPPLDEGSLLVMPATFPGISIEEARRALRVQDKIIKSFAEVETVHGKTGRAETSTDSAQLEMIETVVALKPHDQWPKQRVPRWYSSWAPGWLRRPLATVWPDERPRSIEELKRDLARALETPGFQLAVSPPIRTRIDMLTTGVRTPVGVKVLGGDLGEVERISVELEGILREVPGTRSTFAERQTGREYVDVTPKRDAIARYGLSVRDVNEMLEAAIGGTQVSTVIAGRSRFSMNVRYGADFRSEPSALANLLVGVPSSASALQLTAPPSGTSSQLMGNDAATGSAPATSAMGSMATKGSMGAGMGRGGGATDASMATSGAIRPQGMSAELALAEPGGAWSQAVATVPLSELADIQVTTGPPMIKDENGVLAGYVFADLDSAERDLGSYVEDAKRLVAARLELPPGYRIEWTGQYEFMAETEERLKTVLPLTLVLIVLLLHMSLRSWQQTLIVFVSIPFTLAGCIWLLAGLGYHFSTAVWVGIIAVGGLAAELGTVMVLYVDEAYQRRLAAGRLTGEDINEAVVEGAAKRVRPKLMTVAAAVLSLAPLLWSEGVGADVTARTAAPLIGGLFGSTIVTLFVTPSLYAIWRHWQLKRRKNVLAPATHVPAH
ncbi:MAG: efflux RND transporter permease subunit [Myxococcota bacterium]